MTQQQKAHSQPVSPVTTELPACEADSQLTAYVASAAEAVRQAQAQVCKAQEQLQEAQEVEKALLELTQLQEVRQAHQALYGPDKATGLTAAQQYVAFKKTLREQPQ